MSVVPLDAAAVGVGLSTACFLAWWGCDCKKPGLEPPPDTGVKDAETSAIPATTETAVNEVAATGAPDQPAPGGGGGGGAGGGVLTPQEIQLNAQVTKIQDEIDTYNKQWQVAQQGIDPTDPGYITLKQQYDDYQNYLKGQLSDVNSQINQIEIEHIQEQVVLETHNDWIKQQQNNLIQVKEQKSFLQATVKGYSGHQGYDISGVTKQLDDLNKKEQEITSVLNANNASIDYTPQHRDPIGPDPDTVKLNQTLQAKKKALDDEIAKGKAARDEVHKTEVENEQAWLVKQMAVEHNKAFVWNVITKGTEAVQVIADTSIDALSNVTGPVGKTIKTAYTGLKGVAGGVGEGLAGGDMGKNILKGTVSGFSDVIKDKIGDKYGKGYQAVFTVASETGKGALEAGLEGKDMVDGAIKGGLKGTVSATTSAALDTLLPSKEMPKGIDWSGMTGGKFASTLISKNPLANSTNRSLWQGLGSMTNISRQAVSEGVKSTGKDIITGYVKGEEVPVVGWKQGVTEKAIDLATPVVRKGGAALGQAALQSPAGQAAIQATKTLAQAVNNAVNDPGIPLVM